MRCTCTHIHRGRIVSYEIPGGDGWGTVGKTLRGRGIKWHTAHRTGGGIAKICLSWRGGHDVWKCSLRKGWETKRTSTGSDDTRCREGSCLFYRVEAKMYDIVLGKVAGFYFRDPVPFPSAHAFLSLPFCSYTPSPFSANGINFRPRSTTQWHARALIRFFFSYHRPFSRSQTREPYQWKWDCNYIASIERQW